MLQEYFGSNVNYNGCTLVYFKGAFAPQAKFLHMTLHSSSIVVHAAPKRMTHAVLCCFGPAFIRNHPPYQVSMNLPSCALHPYYGSAPHTAEGSSSLVPWVSLASLSVWGLPGLFPCRVSFQGLIGLVLFRSLGSPLLCWIPVTPALILALFDLSAHTCKSLAMGTPLAALLSTGPIVPDRPQHIIPPVASLFPWSLQTRLRVSPPCITKNDAEVYAYGSWLLPNIHNNMSHMF